MRLLAVRLVLALAVFGLVAGCAAVGEAQDLARLQSNMKKMMEDGGEPDEEELRSIAFRPLPSPPGAVYDLSLLRASTAALLLGDLKRVREVRSLAERHSTNPATKAGVLSSNGLAEQFSGNFVAAMRLQEQAIKVRHPQDTKQPRTPQQSRVLLNDLNNLAIAAIQAGDYAEVERVAAQIKRLTIDLKGDDYGRAIAHLRLSRLEATLLSERDGNYLEAYEKLRAALTRFRETGAKPDPSAETDSSFHRRNVADTMPFLVSLAIGAGRMSSASMHLSELRAYSVGLPADMASQWLSDAEISYRQALRDYAGALESHERRGQGLRQIEKRWLMPRFRAAAIRAQYLGGLERWPEALEALRSVPEGLTSQPSVIRDYFLGIRAISAAMVGVDDPSTALILARETHYKKLRGNANYLMFVAAKTIIHYRLGERHGSPSEYAAAVAAGRELARELRGLQVSGARRDTTVAEWLIQMAKDAYAASAGVALIRGGATRDDVVDAVLLLQMSDLDTDIAAAAARRTSIPGVSAVQLRRLQDLQQVSRQAQRQVSVAALAADADPDYLVRISAQASAAAEELDRHLSEVRLTAPQITQAWGSSARIQVSDIQRRLASDEAVAVFAPLAKASTLALLISPRGFSHEVVPIGKDQLALLVNRIRTSATFDAAVQVPDFDVNASHELYQHLFGWMGNAVVPVKSMNVVAGGPLGAIPFGLLLKGTERQTRPNEYRSMPWLIRSMAINHVPSVSAWYAVTSPQAATKATGFLAWADPDFTGQPVTANKTTRAVRRGLRSMAASSASGAGQLPSNLGELLSPLPETKDEARAIARALGASIERDVVAGASATRSSVLKESASGALARRKVVMFATHGLAPSQLPGLDQPALAMAQELGTTMPSLLQLDDVVALQVDADWVLLSACSTAAADSLGGDPLSGLVRGFFFAGARGLLVTHWEVESESAAAITTRTIQRFVRNPKLTRAQALQQTAIELIDGRNAPADWAHPAFWAAYALVGNGGRGTAER